MARRRKRHATGKRSSGLLPRTLRRLGLGGRARSRRRDRAASGLRVTRLMALVAFLMGAVVGAVGIYTADRIDSAGAPAETAQAGSGGAAPETAAEIPPATTAVMTTPASEPTKEDVAAPTVAYEESPVTTAEEPSREIMPPSLTEAEIAALLALPPAQTWLANARPAVDAGGQAMIAIVIDDVGVNRAHAPLAIGLPGPVTLSFMSYASDLDVLTADARRRGHELLLHLPMQPMDPAVDAGPHSLRVDQSEETLRMDLAWALARFDGYIGVNNHMGSRFTRSPEAMAIVMAELRKSGLMFLDSRTVGDSVGSAVAGQLGVPHLERDIFLDNDPSEVAIRAQLVELERIAHERGQAIGIGHPYPSTIQVLNEWLPTLGQRGIVLVPVSTILRRKLGVAG